MIIKDIKCTFYPNPSPSKQREYFMFLESTNSYSSGTLGIICAFISYLAIAIQSNHLKKLLEYKPPKYMLSLDLMAMSVAPNTHNELTTLYKKLLPITDLQSLVTFFLMDSKELWKSREQAIKCIFAIFADIKSWDTKSPYFKCVAQRFQQSIVLYNEKGVEIEKFPFEFKDSMRFTMPLVKCGASVGIMISKEMYFAINPETTIQYCKYCKCPPTIFCNRLHMTSILKEEDLLEIAIHSKMTENMEVALQDIQTIPKTDYKKSIYSKSIISHLQSKTKYIKSATQNIILPSKLIEQLFQKYKGSEKVQNLSKHLEMSKNLIKKLSFIEEFKFPTID